MRTTLHLPDDLYREIRLIAADQGRTITSVVEEALRAHVSQPPPTPGRYRVDVIHPAPGTAVPAIDAGDNAALRDLMDSEDQAQHATA